MLGAYFNSHEKEVLPKQADAREYHAIMKVVPYWQFVLNHLIRILISFHSCVTLVPKICWKIAFY